MATIEEIRVPDIGDFHDVEVIEVLVAVGDRVAREQSLLTLESDKASMEIPAPIAGTVTAIQTRLGDRVSAGSLILTLTTESASEVNLAPATAAGAPGTPPGKPTAGSQRVAVSVPDIGDFKDVEIIEVLVAPGDAVQAEQSLITLESDKASMEVPSPRAGRVIELRCKIGDRVSAGSAVLMLDTGAAANDLEPAPEPAAAAATRVEAPAAAPRPAPLEAVAETGFRKAHASPAVRRFARELGADISRIKGSGPKKRILKEDVKAWVKGALARTATPAASVATAGIPPIPDQDFSQFGDIETLDVPRIKRISGPHLHRAWLNLPMVTHHDEADISELEAFRKTLKTEAEQQQVRVTALVFILKALVDALRKYPGFNASLIQGGEKLVYKKYFNIGVAIDTPNGLVVPVVRDVDRKGIFDLSAEIAALSAKARDGKLKPADLQGGCISVSSLGGIGGTAFTPIVNAPEVAILGVTRARMQPVWTGAEFVPRLMLPLDLTYDHRAIDGAEAARFCTRLCQSLGDVRRLLL